jgi:tyrosine-protein kinase
VELREIVRTVRRFWPVALGALLACLAVGGAVAGLSQKQYEATATLAIRPQSAGSVELVEFLIPSLEARAESRSLRHVLQAAAGGRADTFHVNAVTNPGTGVMRIVVRGSDREAVAPLANSVARQLQHPLVRSRVLSLQVLDAAVRPAAPMAPATVPLLLSALVLGVILAVFSALAALSISRRRLGAAGLRDRLGVPVLGTIPRRVRGQAGRWPSAPQLLQGSDDEAIEAFQAVRANTEMALLSKGVRSVAVTGVGEPEVAAGIAATLGWSLAAVGHRVLLVEGDLRRPALGQALGGVLKPADDVADDYELFRLQDAPGLALRLLPANSMRQLGQAATRWPTSGSAGQHPVETLRLGLPKLLRAHDQAGGLTIVNTPSLHVVDSKLVASMTGSAVVVADVTRRAALTALEQGLAEFRDAGVDVLGIVLVRRSRRRARASTPTRGATTGDRGRSTELDDPFAGFGVDQPQPAHGLTGRSGRHRATIGRPDADR